MRALFLAIVVFAAAHAAPAAAQLVSPTFVSSAGSDLNPCSRAQPCRTMNTALAKTGPDGMVLVLDSGTFGSVSITRPVTIAGLGPATGVAGFAANAVVINAPGGRVSLLDLMIDGVNAGSDSFGVNVIAASLVTISNCHIRGFRNPTAGGVRVATETATRVLLRDTLISDSTVGVTVAAAGSGLNAVTLENVILDAISLATVRADGSRSRVILRRSTALGAPLEATNGAEIRSFGDNAIGDSDPTRSLPLK